MKQLIEEISGPNPIETANEQLRDAVAELVLVNLWFALKFVAGYAGPYDELDIGVDIDSCNFYQEYCEEPGARCAVFMPRGHYKSTIFTTGATWWDLLRWPELKICIGNAKKENAAEFMMLVARMFDSNDFVKWLFPGYDVNYNSLDRWNTSELVVPVRRKYAKEPSVASIGVGGASEGNHFNKLRWDDLIGLKALNADRRSNAEMFKSVNWMLTNQRTLLHKVGRDQVWIIGTRYGVDDAYTQIAEKLKRIVGYGARYELNPDEPVWTLYNREVEEDGQIIKPEVIDREELEALAKDDWWTYVTQYKNAPEESGLNEFNSYETGTSQLEYQSHRGWLLSYWTGTETVEMSLGECDVGLGADPAATERYISARTSKSAVVVWAHDWMDNLHLVSCNSGYVAAHEFIDWIFAAKKKFQGSMRVSCIEMNAGFKMLGPMIRREEQARTMPVNLRGTPAVGEKDARIRTVFEPLLAGRKIYLCEGVGTDFLAEKGAFPQGHTKDVLDASAHVIPQLHRPEPPEERQRRQVRRENHRVGRSRITGY